MAYPNGWRYFGARYWNARYFSYQGSNAVPVADSPQLITINITITQPPQPPPLGDGVGRVVILPWSRPGIFVIGRIPDPS